MAKLPQAEADRRKAVFQKEQKEKKNKKLMYIGGAVLIVGIVVYLFRK